MPSYHHMFFHNKSLLVVKNKMVNIANRIAFLERIANDFLDRRDIIQSPICLFCYNI